MDSSYLEVVIFECNVYVKRKKDFSVVRGYRLHFYFFPFDSQHKWKIDLGLCRTESELRFIYTHCGAGDWLLFDCLGYEVFVTCRVKEINKHP